jgi:hypothetical protein
VLVLLLGALATIKKIKIPPVSFSSQRVINT